MSPTGKHIRPIVSLLALTAATTASAICPILPEGIDVGVSMSDDDTEPFDVSSVFPSGINYFGTTYSSLNLNSNGNITFGGGFTSFTPSPFPIAGRPMIAPFDHREQQIGVGVALRRMQHQMRALHRRRDAHRPLAAKQQNGQNAQTNKTHEAKQRVTCLLDSSLRCDCLSSWCRMRP